jgi:DNA-binding NarL/FixJ family response regulator
LLLRKFKDACAQGLVHTKHGILFGATSYEATGEIPVMNIMHTEEVRMSLVRILVVDDFSPWQDFVRVCLKERSDVRILDVASNGLEAIQKAADLQPDLILLDISLPEIGGIEAAERIRQLVPKIKIIFLTGHADPEIVQNAFRAGGDGYVLKWDAAEDLMVGMESVLSGKKFTSRGVTGI